MPDGTLLFVRDHDEDGWVGADLFQLRPGQTKPERMTRMVGAATSPRPLPAATNKLYFVAFDPGASARSTRGTGT